MEWTPTFSVDIKIIDLQHQKLFGYVNTLYDALTERKEREILTQLFNDLEGYTQTHFKFEEVYFDKFNFIGKDAHVLQHEEFIKKLALMKKQILEGSRDVEDLLDFLMNWLIHHIKGTDREYIICFHEHGMH